MPSHTLKKLTATTLVVALAAMYAPAFAAAPTATLTGTVFGDNVTTPLAGATVVVTDAAGAKLSSRPTGADGAFTVAGVAPGAQQLAIATADGSFAIATPITLAPGETKGVRLALKASGDKEKEKKNGGAYWTGGAKAAMIAVIVGFAAAGAIGISQAGDDSKPEASPYVPPDDSE